MLSPHRAHPLPSERWLNPGVAAQVYGFRATLWEEHWGTWKPCFERPESPECVQEIKNLSRINWEHYVQPEVLKLPGHAMPYPIQVLLASAHIPGKSHERPRQAVFAVELAPLFASAVLGSACAAGHRLLDAGPGHSQSGNSAGGRAHN